MKKLKKVFLMVIAISFLFVVGNWLRLNYESYLVRLQGKNVINVSLNQDFFLVKNQAASIETENLRIKLLKITYQPCSNCFWSGMGADFEVTKDGQMKNGSTAIESNINNVYFGYEVDLTSVKPTKVGFRIKKVS